MNSRITFSQTRRTSPTCQTSPTRPANLFSAALALAAALAAPLFLPSANAEDTARPNVILILADDMAPGDLASVNGGLSTTPRLDALAGESAVFESAYAGSPVCAPSRAALLTGRYPHRTGSVTLNQHNYPELTRIKRDETTIADRFRASGYATGIVGKWHSGPGEKYEPRRRGFDEAAIFHDATEVKSYFRFQLDHDGEIRHYDDGRYLTDVLTERAVDFVRRHREAPFFLHLAHYAPHRPLSAPEEVVERYTATGIVEKTAKVYAMVEIMDHGIGILLDELDALGLAENTLVIFTSDNGPDPVVGDRLNAPLRGTKYMVNEGGIRVPFFVRWTGAIEPGRRPEPVHFTDVVPTLMEICRLEKSPAQEPLPLDGASFAALLSDEYSNYSPPERRFWQWNRAHPIYSHNAAVREGDWKLVRPFVTKNVPEGSSPLAPKLYHLAKDPGETHDLADQHPDLRDRLDAELEAWSVEMERDRTRSSN